MNDKVCLNFVKKIKIKGKSKIVKEFVNINVVDGEFLPGIIFTDGSLMVIYYVAERKLPKALIITNHHIPQGKIMNAKACPKFVKNIKGKTVKEYVNIDVGDGEIWPGITLTDGSLMIIQRDSEGNGGGFISYEDKFIKNIEGKITKEYVNIDVGDGEIWPGIIFTDGSLMVIQRDAEGNGGGFISYKDKNGDDLGFAGCC